MSLFVRLEAPRQGRRIEVEGDRLIVPDDPVIPFIEGDGIGPDITAAMKVVLDAAVQKTYGGQRRIVWFEIHAGEKAQELYGEVLPRDTYTAIEHYVVAIKGPLTTPVAGGYRSLNVSMRQKLNLYACVRPVRWYPGVPSPVKEPSLLNAVIFRENTEDVYAGIEWQEGSPEVRKVISFLNEEMGTQIREDSGIGIKPISVTGTKRLVRKAIRYAIDKKRPSVTLVHKGNIMKFTEGAFKDWGYEVAATEFRDQTITEDELWDMAKGADGVTPTERPGAFSHLREGRPAGDPGDRIIVKDRIADAMFQQVLTRPAEYSVLALPNLNGDYISDACAAQVGGLGMAPGGNIGDSVALFEATHGSAPKYRGMDKVNPGSLVLSGAMMLEYLGWDQAAEAVHRAIGQTIQQKKVTYDLARLMGDVRPIRTSEFARAVADNL